MDDEELMGRLSAARPSIAPRSGPLHATLEDVVAESRHQRRRRKRFVFTGITLSVILLGGGSAAIASPSVLTWLGFVPNKTFQHVNAAGDFCAAGIIIHPEGVPVNDPSFLAARAILL